MSSEITPEQRRQLWRLFEQGKGAKEIAKEAKIAPAMVDHFLYGKPLRKPKPTAATQEKEDPPIPAQPKELTTEQKQLIPTILLKGASEYGYEDDQWLPGRLKAVVESVFGVEVSTSRVTYWLKKWLPGEEAFLQGDAPKLSQEDKSVFFEMLQLPPTVYGVDRESWTAELAQQLLFQTFQVSYSQATMTVLLREAIPDRKRTREEGSR